MSDERRQLLGQSSPNKNICNNTAFNNNTNIMQLGNNSVAQSFFLNDLTMTKEATTTNTTPAGTG